MNKQQLNLNKATAAQSTSAEGWGGVPRRGAGGCGCCLLQGVKCKLKLSFKVTKLLDATLNPAADAALNS